MTLSEPGVEYLLDTNIIIYLSLGEEKYVRFVESLQRGTVGISAVTYMEALMGIGGQEEQDVLDAVIENVFVIPFTHDIARKCANPLRSRQKRSIRDPFFADVVIANTALSLGVPLITNNPKDFSRFAGLKVIVPGKGD